MICYINDQFTKFSTLFNIILINHNNRRRQEAFKISHIISDEAKIIGSTSSRMKLHILNIKRTQCLSEINT